MVVKLLSDRAGVLLALAVSVLLHAGVYSMWPRLQTVPASAVLMQGELVAPKTEQPPLIEPPSAEAKPEPQPEPQARSRENKKPDSGVALPLITESAQEPGVNDYRVPETPPIHTGDVLPMASKVGTTALDEYNPSSALGSSAEPSYGDGEDAVDREALARYAHSLREQAAQSGSYPMQAQRRGWQGRVKVLVRYSRSGALREVEVKQSSGHPVLDESALKMVRKACAEVPLLDVLNGKAFSVVVPVDFKLQ